jgi:hypothetical protein
MTVELLWWEGCPSHPQALAELEGILRDEGVEADIQRLEILDDDQARRERFPGSPTIRINGEDIIRADGEPYSLTCRVYRRRDGKIRPTPDPEDVRDAVRRAA